MHTHAHVQYTHISTGYDPFGEGCTGPGRAFPGETT